MREAAFNDLVILCFCVFALLYLTIWLPWHRILPHTISCRHPLLVKFGSLLKLQLFTYVYIFDISKASNAAIATTIKSQNHVFFREKIQLLHKQYSMFYNVYNCIDLQYCQIRIL